MFTLFKIRDLCCQSALLNFDPVFFSLYWYLQVQVLKKELALVSIITDEVFEKLKGSNDTEKLVQDLQEKSWKNMDIKKQQLLLFSCSLMP